MATSSKRDVRLDVEIETTGEESLRSLADDVRRLAKEGGDAAVEYQRIAAQLDKLAEQAAAINTFKELSTEVERLTQQQTEARTAAAGLAQELTKQREVTEGLRKSQRDAQDELDKATQALRERQRELQRLNAQTAEAKAGDASFAETQSKLKLAIVSLKESVDQKRAALRDAKAEVAAVLPAERALEQQYAATNATAERTGAALRERNAALRAAEAAAVAAGASTTDLVQAETALIAAANEGRTAALQLRDARRQQAEAAEQAAVSARALAELDEQNAAVQERLQQSLLKASERYEKQAAEMREAARAAELLAAATREQAEADRLATLEAIGLAEAQQRGAAAAQAELAALRQSEQFMEQYAAAAARATERTIALGKAARVSLADEFGTTGVRSLQAIENEIRDVNAAVGTLERQMELGRISVADFARAASSAQVRLQTLRREMATIPSPEGIFEQANTGLNNLINRFGSLTAAIGTVGIAVSPILDVTIALEKITRVLTTVTGSAAEAGRQVEFLRDVAQRSGTSFSEIGESYAKFAASALQVGISTKDTQEVFERVALAAGNMGLSSDQARRALEALSQIASKGTVSMEELRQQLGDALPGVLPALARELGVTDAELNKLVESGNLLAFEAIPAIGRALQNLGPGAGGAVSGFVAEWNRFKNILSETTTIFTTGAFGQAIGIVLKGISDGLGFASLRAAMFSEEVTRTSEKLSLILTALSEGSIKGLGDAFERVDERSRDRLQNLVNRVRRVGDESQGAVGGAQALGDALGQMAQDAEGAGAAAEKTAKLLSVLALETQKRIDLADADGRAAEKLAQARQQEAQSIERVIALSGDEAAVKRVAAEQQALYAAALQRQADLDEASAAARRAARDALLTEAEAQGLSTEKIKSKVEALDKEIKSTEASAEKSRVAAQAQEAVALAARLAAEVLKDNAGRLDQYSDAAEGAERALEGVRRAFLRGKATTEDVARAEKDLAIAKRLLNDAIDDQLERSDRQADALIRQAELTNALIRVEIVRLGIERDKALALGQETLARQLSLRIAEAELQMTQNTTDAKRAEANEIIRSQVLRRAELEARGLLTPAIQAEINALVTKAQIQLAEADATVLSTSAKAEHLEKVKNGTAELDRNTASTRSNTDAVSGSTSSTSANTTERRANTDAISKQADAQKRLNELMLADPTRLVGGNGLGAIGKSQDGSGDFGVRSPNSGTGGNGSNRDGTTSDFSEDPNTFNNLYNNTPDGGITRTGGGQYLPPDDTGTWEFDTQAWREAGSPILVNNGSFAYWKKKGSTGRLAGTRPGLPSFGSSGASAPSPSPAPAPSPAAAAAPAPAAGGAVQTIRIDLGNGVTRTMRFADRSSADEFLRLLEEDFRAAGGG